MRRAHQRSEDANLFRAAFDMSTLMLVGFVMIVVILLVVIGEQDPSEDSVQQGNVIVELYWDDQLNTDVDLWGKSPGDERPVGYSNKGGRVLNLLRDDLGHINDLGGRNMEIMTSRGTPAGEWAFNVHLFRLRDGALPLAVRLIVSLTHEGKRPKELFDLRRQLAERRQEITVIRFRLDGEGRLEPGSDHHDYVPLRAARRP